MASFFTVESNDSTEVSDRDRGSVGDALIQTCALLCISQSPGLPAQANGAPAAQ